MTFSVPSKSVFISVGNGLTDDQEAFVFAIEALLQAQDIQPMTLGRNVRDNGAPLKAIQTMVSSTLGTLVIAFVRLHIAAAVEHPGSGRPTPVAQRDLPTVWNHIEAAMAYQAEKPLLILTERGLHSEGIIDPLAYPGVTFVLPSKRGVLPSNLQNTLKQWITSLQTER